MGRDHRSGEIFLPVTDGFLPYQPDCMDGKPLVFLRMQTGYSR